MTRSMLSSALLALLYATSVVAQDWQPVTIELLKSQKTGFGGLCGVVVHPTTGDVIVNLSDCGFFRSKDRGTTWQRLGSEIKGRTETPLCLMVDPVQNKRIVSTLVYGSPIVTSVDGEGNWKMMAPQTTHVDWCAVDWSDPDLGFVLTLKHESGDVLISSHDGGKTFEEIGKGYGPAWIFNVSRAVVAEAKSKENDKPGLLLTEDGGKTFQRCRDDSVRALPRFSSGTLFWLTTTGLISTRDQGKTWNRLSDVKDGICGPVFGKDNHHLFLLTNGGIRESKDGGTTWEPAIALPAGMKGANHLSWLAYDGARDIIYVMKMGSELYQWKRTP